MLSRQVFAVVILFGGCSTASKSTPDSEEFCSPFRAQRLNEEAGCLEDVIEFRCDNGGCDDVVVDAVDPEGNCYHMLGCAPPEWQSTLEDQLPEHCALLASSPPACSALADASLSDAADDASVCVPFRAQRLNEEAGCLEDLIEFRCDNGGCDDVEVDAVDPEGNCYHMLGCAPPEWQSTLEDQLPEHCALLASAPPACSALADTSVSDAASDAAL